MAETGVRMFTTTWCGYCKLTKRFLDSKGVAFEEIDIEEYPDFGPKIEELTGGYRTVPTLDVAGKWMVNPDRKALQDALVEAGILEA
ncbi:MAG: glutaredoxin family protein [Chloroflexota bacterium]